ncbi:hypothetical protein OKW46_007379 [Paraburkholderia sp. WSM4179]|nr:hypothetical protein [Paraburkholderia sp. WSM4179]
MKKTKSLYHGHRFPASVISQAVRWYFRFELSLRDIEELLFERGVVVSHESIRRWTDKIGTAFIDGYGFGRAILIDGLLELPLGPPRDCASSAGRPCTNARTPTLSRADSATASALWLPPDSALSLPFTSFC